MKENTNEHTEPIISPELLGRAKAKDREALGELYKKTQLDIYRTIHSMIRDEDTTLDIQQDTYLRAFSCLDQLRDAASFLPWLRQIAVNEARAQLRKKHPLAFSELSSDEDEDYFPDLPDLSLDSSPELSLDRKENNRLIREILSGLSDGQRMLLGMFYYEQMPLKQIAEETGLSVNTIKVQLHRGRKRVETEVKKLEAQGVKLYGLAPLPFLLALWRQQSPAAQAGEAVLAQTLEKAGVSAGAKAVAAAASGGAASGAGAVAIHVGRSFFESGVGKLVLGVIVAGVIGGGAAGWRWYETHRSEPEIQTTEAPEELRVIPTAPPHTREEAIAVTAPQEDTGEDLISEPVTTEPQPTEPQPTEPQPTEPQPTEPKPTEPKPTEPKPTEPKPTEPAPTNPEPTEPGPAEPEPAEPGPAEPGPAEPSPTEPKPTEPKPTEPTPTEPEQPVTERPDVGLIVNNWSIDYDHGKTLYGYKLEPGTIRDLEWNNSYTIEVKLNRMPSEETNDLPFVYSDNTSVVSFDRIYGVFGGHGYGCDCRIVNHGPGTAHLTVDFGGGQVLRFTVINPEYPEKVIETSSSVYTREASLNMENRGFEDCYPESSWEIKTIVQGFAVPELTTDNPAVFQPAAFEGFYSGETTWIRRGWKATGNLVGAGDAHIFLKLNGEVVHTWTVHAYADPEETEP